MTLTDFIKKLPKAELHCHIEGTLEPEMMFDLAQKNKIQVPFKDPAEVRKAYEFSNLQSFLDIYYQGANVLQTDQDFYELTWAYLDKIHKDNVIHTEIFFDPQTHTDRGIAFATAIEGIHAALADAEKKLGITSKLIMCFLRHLSEESAFETLKQSLPYKKWIIAVGLDSGEKGNPPEKFQRVFQQAHEEGLLAVAHAGEEGPADYIWQALKLLHAKRIDHGVRCVEDDKLVQYLAQHQIPLTVCPLSNIKLCVFKDMQEHNIKALLDKGLCVTINSDDPAYFGGYMNDNFIACANALKLNEADLVKLVNNSFNASFIDKDQKEEYLQRVRAVVG